MHSSEHFNLLLLLSNDLKPGVYERKLKVLLKKLLFSKSCFTESKKLRD
ncbi:hypothetical protein LLB_0805 [Legionella longbeachae D-4968]|nr:hypothetical protein LLB_0805 [Legionella longbeachae D-4968]